MGAGKLPEQIADRREAGRRAILEDQTRDPVIERLKAQPIDRKVEPEEKSVRRQLSTGARKGTQTIARKMALSSALKAAYAVIEKLKERVARLGAERAVMDQQVTVLKNLAKRQAKEIERLQKAAGPKKRH